MTLTKPPSPYRERFTMDFNHGQVAGNAVKATGVVTCVAKASFVDTDFFTVGDGVNPAVIYEWDTAGDNVGSGTAFKAVKATGAFTVGAKAIYIDGENMIVATSPEGVVDTFEADVAGDGVTAGSIQVNISAATDAASVGVILAAAMVANLPWLTVVDNLDGTITATADEPGAESNNATFTENVTDGGHIVPATLTGGLDAGGPLDRRVQVDISGDTTAADCAARLKTAIEANQPLISVVDPTDGTLNLTNDQPGAAANITITENVGDGGFTVSGMTGGLDATANVIGDTNEQLMVATRPFRIDSARYVNATGLVAHAANYFNIKILKGASTAFNWSTETGQEGTLAAGTWAAMVAGAAADQVFAKDDELDLFLDETGTAVLPAGRVVLECSYL